MSVRATVGQFTFDLSMALTNLALRFPSHPWRRLVLRLAGVRLGEDVTVARRVQLHVRGRLEIGSRTIVNEDIVLDARGGLTIGADVNLSPGVKIFTADHDPRSPDFAGRNRAVEIGSRAWIATDSLILPGAVIGEGAVVGAASVVHGVVDPWTMVAGNPARVIGPRPADAQRGLTPYRRFFH